MRRRQHATSRFNHVRNRTIVDEDPCDSRLGTTGPIVRGWLVDGEYRRVGKTSLSMQMIHWTDGKTVRYLVR
jgi:hypothetical protein